LIFNSIQRVGGASLSWRWTRKKQKKREDASDWFHVFDRECH